MFDRVQQWLHQLVIAVPGEVSVCEFDCDRTECRFGDWVSCRRRLGQEPEKSLEDSDSRTG
jgi:hypothetical protein